MDNALEQTTVDDALIADEHDDPACECGACARVAARDRAEADGRHALACGGIAPWAHELLGVGWIDGGRMGEEESASEFPSALPWIATRAIGDVFGQLSRIATEGVNLAYPGLRATLDGSQVAPSPPITRAQALGLIAAADSALAYAREQLRWLPPGDSAGAAT